MAKEKFLKYVPECCKSYLITLLFIDIVRNYFFWSFLFVKEFKKDTIGLTLWLPDQICNSPYC